MYVCTSCTLTQTKKLSMTPFLLHKFRMAAHNPLPSPKVATLLLIPIRCLTECSSAPAAIFFLNVRQPLFCCGVCVCVAVIIIFIILLLLSIVWVRQSSQITINCYNLHILSVVSKLVFAEIITLVIVALLCLSIFSILLYCVLLCASPKYWVCRQNAT